MIPAPSGDLYAIDIVHGAQTVPPRTAGTTITALASSELMFALNRRGLVGADDGEVSWLTKDVVRPV